MFFFSLLLWLLLRATVFPYATLFRSPPVGLLVSGVMVKVLLVVRLALLWAVMVWLPLALTAPVQVDGESTRLLSSYMTPLYEAVWLGRMSLRMPESLSLEVAAAWKLP